MDSTRDEMLQAAEAEASRLQEELFKREAERDAAGERLDQLEEAPFDTPEEEAELSRQVEEADRQAGRTEELYDEAERDWLHAQEHVDDLSGADGHDDDADEDTGETLSVHDAADIWMSSGMDEDYTSGYTEDELRRALEE